MSNPMKDYVDNFRANLPSGVTYDADIARYFANGKRFLNEWEAERYINYIQKFGFSVSPIEAVVFLNLGELVDGETIASAMTPADYDQASNYTSSDGTIDTVVASATVNGSPALFTDTVSFNDVVSVSVVVTDSTAEERTFSAGTQTVQAAQGIVPTIAASDSLIGRTLTITVDSTTGDPAPTTTLATLTLDGSPVSPTTSGSGVWTYDVPDNGSDRTVLWRVEANNAAGTASAFGNRTLIQYLADTYQPIAAVSLRELSSSTTNVVRVRRDSNNNELDFTATDVAGGALETWVGATGNGYIVRLFDQSGNGEDFTQPTTSDQPIIVENGSLVTRNGKPAFKQGPGQTLQIPGTLYPITDLYMVGGFVNDALTQFGMISSIGSFETLLYLATPDSTLTDVTRNTGNPTFYINGEQQNWATRAETFTALDPDFLLSVTNIVVPEDRQINRTGRGGQSGVDQETLNEIILYDTNQAANRVFIEQDQAAYYGITHLADVPNAPDKPDAPKLVGGTTAANITTGSTTPDGGAVVTGYEYEVTDAADTAFASPVATGTATPLNLGAEISPLTAGSYIARQRLTNRAGTSFWSDASEAVTVSASSPAVTLPTFEEDPVYVVPDPSQAVILFSNTPASGIAVNPCAFPCWVDVRSFPEFDGVVNGSGERLNWLFYGSDDHSAIASIYLFLVFGDFGGTSFMTYEDALAAGHLANYDGTTPDVAAGGWSFNHNPADPISSETPWVWKEGSTWYLTYHGFYGELPQTTQYATSTSPFGPWNNQGGFLPTDDKSNHNGYASFVQIPPEAEVAGPFAEGQTGQFLITALNFSGNPGHTAQHIANRDLTGATMVTALTLWSLEIPVTARAPEGKMLVANTLTESSMLWTGSEFTTLSVASFPGGTSGSIVERGIGRNLRDSTRLPEVILYPDELTEVTLDRIGSPEIFEDGGQTYLVCSGATTNNSFIYRIPVTVTPSAQGVAPRVFDDHYYDEVDYSQYSDYWEAPSQWSIEDLSGNPIESPPSIIDGRLVLSANLALQYDPGFNPVNTDFMRFEADGGSTSPAVTTQRYLYGFGSDSPGLNNASPAVLYGDNALEIRDGVTSESFTPSGGLLSIWPGGIEWDIAGETINALQGNGVPREFYDLTTQQTSDISGSQKYPYFLQRDGATSLSVGKMSVRLRGADHTNNAAPIIADAVTDVAGTKVTVTMDRDFLGRYGLVLSVGGTVIDATPTRTGKSTIELARDTGTFSSSDEIKLHYETGGDIRSDPQWVYLPATSDINVKNEVV